MSEIKLYTKDFNFYYSSFKALTDISLEIQPIKNHGQTEIKPKGTGHDYTVHLAPE